METTYPRQNYLLLLLSMILFGTAFFLERRISLRTSDYEVLTAHARKMLARQEERISVLLDSIVSHPPVDPARMWDDVPVWLDRFDDPPQGFSLLIYKGDKLLYWSDNAVMMDPSSMDKTIDRHLVFLRNGWYECFKQTWGPYTLNGLLLIKYEYPFSNKYITNHFNPAFRLPDAAGLATEKGKGYWPVNSNRGDYLFSVFYPDDAGGTELEIPIMVLFFSAMAAFLLFLYSYIKHLAVRQPLPAFLICGFLVTLRWLALHYRIPETFYNLSLFSPRYYASSYLLNSLGDFLISALVFTFLVVFLHHYFNRIREGGAARGSNAWVSTQVVFVFLFTFLFSVFVNYLLSGLILDSKISFNINNIFELSGYSLIGFAIIGLLLFSFYLICDGSIRFIQRTRFTSGQISILFLVTQGLFLLILLWLRDTEFFKDYGVTSFLLANSLIIFISYIRSSARKLFSFSRTLLVILGFSIYAAKTIADFNDIKEKEARKLLALKLENDHDLVAEYLYEEAAGKIARDRFVSAFLMAAGQQVFPFTLTQEVMERRIQQLYLNGYWSRFDINIRFYDRYGRPVGMNMEKDPAFQEIEGQVFTEAAPTRSNGFYYLGNTAGRASYAGRVDVPQSGDTATAGRIILLLNARFADSEGGFPDLLLSDRIPEQKDYSNYSYAKYEASKLVRQYGKYPYFNQSATYEKQYGVSRIDRFYDFNGYSHLFYRYGASGLIIISRPNQSIMVFITLFSYIFSFFCMLFVSIYILYKLVKNSFRFEVNFKTRIQFMVFAIVMATILMTGGGTIYYIIGNYSANQNQKVSEKLTSLLILVQHELERKQVLPGNPDDELVYSLSRLSTNLSLDFNIYRTDGMLAFSTQPRIFEQGILARTMNAFAFNELHVRQRTQFLHYEQMGRLNFLSAYEPLRNSRNEVIGYINLPYFAKQNVLKKEISSLLVTLINIYVFLFSLAMFATYIISNRITRPLGLIQSHLSQIKLGRRTEPMEWNRKDEIGALVNEYNSMVDELHESTELLARSERESAWREMAKQVAHEIKNPLTPMKLSVQHLQRAWRERSPNLESIMQRFSQTLIEQIDTLSNIATEFSNFAKMPKVNNAVLNLASILGNIVNLYAESEKVRIYFNAGNFGEAEVYADKDQLLRAFSNLLKNAVQAIPDTREGIITVDITLDQKNYIVVIRDNGEGISSDKAEKIFTPNFTTKTGGTGLGLAMVKNTVENAGGRIWFETRPGEGTAFFVSIPAFDGHIA